MTTIPNPPTTGDEFTNELTGITYRYDGEKWLAVSSPVDDSVESLTERVADGETKQSQIEGVITDALVVQANKVDKTGDTMTGRLTAPRVVANNTTLESGRVFEAQSNGTTNAWINSNGQVRTNFVIDDDTEFKTLTTKQYVDDKVGGAGYLPLTGGTLTGDLNLDNKRIQVLDSNGEISFYAQGSGFCKSYDMFRVERAIDGPAFQSRIDSTVNAEIRTNGNAFFKGTVNMHSNKIINVLTPTSDNDAANKSYVDTKAGECLPLSGGTMTGNITFAQDKQLATEEYVDTAVTAAVTPKIYPGLRFGFGNGTVAIGLGNFNYYSDGGNLKLRISNNSKDYKWNDGGLTQDYNLSEGHRFTIYELQNNGSLKIVRTGTYNRLDYHTSDVLVYVSSHKTNGGLTVGNDYYLTLSGIF